MRLFANARERGGKKETGRASARPTAKEKTGRSNERGLMVRHRGYPVLRRGGKKVGLAARKEKKRGPPEKRGGTRLSSRALSRFHLPLAPDGKEKKGGELLRRKLIRKGKKSAAPWIVLLKSMAGLDH